MGRWKDRLKRSLVLLLTVALVGNSARYAMLSVSAEETSAEETDGQETPQDADAQAAEQGDEGMNEELPAEQTSDGETPAGQDGDPETVVVQQAGTVTADAMNAMASASDAPVPEGQETPDEAGNMEQTESEPAEADGASKEESKTDAPSAETPETDASAEDAPEEETVDEAVQKVKEQLAALPSLEELKAQTEDEQRDSYDRIQEVYDAYEALTDEQKAQAGNAEGIFVPLFEYFNGLIMPLEDEETVVELTAELVDLGDTYTSAENGISLFGLNNGTVDLTTGNHEKWIDRIAVEPYAKKFYETLVEASDNDGQDDQLISDRYFSEENTITLNFSSGPLRVKVIEVLEDTRSTEMSETEWKYIQKNIRAAYDAFDRDHPEVFWLSGKTQMAYGGTQKISGSDVSYTYKVYFLLKTYDRITGDFDIRKTEYQSEASVKQAIEKRDGDVSTILATVPSSGTVAQIKALNKWLTHNNEYNTDLSSGKSQELVDQNAWECVSALGGNEGAKGPVCEGYARAFKVLCDRLNIPCVLVDGHARDTAGSNGEAHMWNYVQVDGAWYAVDVTWDDPVVKGTSGKKSGGENEDWLLLGSSSLVKGSTNFTFIESHPATNSPSSGGVLFKNGPVLSESKYEEKNPAAVSFTKTSESVTYTGSAPAISGLLSVTVGESTVSNPNITYSYRAKGSTGAYTDGLPVNAGIYEIKAHVAADANYGSADSSNILTLTITKAAVSITINDTYTGKVYDGIALAVPGKTQVTITGASYENAAFEWYKGGQKLSAAPADAGTYQVKAVVAETGNYSGDSTEKEVTITQRPLTIAAKAQTISFGEQIVTGTGQVDCSGLVSGHTLGSIELTASTTATTNDGTITPSAASVTRAGVNVTANYNITYTAGKLVITKPDLSKAEVTLDGSSYIYDGTDKQPTVTVKLNGKTLASGTDYTVSYENNRNAGTAKVNIAASPNGNYIGNATKTFTISKKPVTAAVTAADKTYDGNTNAVVTGTVGDLASGDTVTVDLTGTFADKNAGTNKKVSVSGTVSGTSAGNYEVTIPGETTASINKKPITVTADSVSKTYGAKDPALTYKMGEDGLVAGDTFTGSLTRAEGKNVGTYAIQQGELTAGSNYEIIFRGGTLTIEPADYTPSAITPQNILTGLGEFIEPTFQGVNDENVTGTMVYTYDGNADKSYQDMVEILAKLELNTTGTITYSFTTKNPNYASGAKTGTIAFTIKDILFEAGGATATVNNAVTIKSAPTYGDSWSDIVKIGAITAVAGDARDNDASHFTLKETGLPGAGSQNFTVVYNGTLNGKTYTNSVVCTGTVDIAQKTITVSAGSSKVSKTYDGTTNAGTLSGSLAVTGILAQDTGVKVSAAPAAYTSPNVGGQTSVQADLTLSGNASGNYRLAVAKLAIPCEILPKSITPSAALTGAGPYTYTGEAITPEIEVKDGNTALKTSDYTLTWSDHINAGTAKVVVTPKAGGNYTWTTPIELTFTIKKAVYTGTKTAERSTRYGREGTFDLAAFLPESYKLGTLQVEDNDRIFQTAPAVAGTIVSYTLVSDPELKGKQAVVTIPVTETRNYEPYEFRLTVTLTDKLEQTGFALEAERLDKIYGDEDFTVSVKNAAPGSRVTYTSSDPAVASVDADGKIHIQKIGTAVITAEASETDDYMSASASCTLTIEPKALLWDVSGLSAADKEGTVSGRKASLYGELQVSGLVKGDGTSFTCPADRLTGTYGAVTPGEQKVTLAWAGDPVTLQGAKSGNYTMPQTLPEITGRINAVGGSLPTPPESSKEVQYQLELEKGISVIPEAFKTREDLNTPAKIDTWMRLDLQKASEYIKEADTEVYDVVLMINIADGGWQEASKENFPSNGLTITLPYPEGTGRKTHDFMVSHLFTEDMNGHRAGDVEHPAVTKTADGIRFKVYGLSPISVGWTDAGVLHNTESGGGGSSHSSGSSGSGSTAAASQQSAVQSAATADDSPILFYAGMLSLSIAGLSCIYAGRRRRRNR